MVTYRNMVKELNTSDISSKIKFDISLENHNDIHNLFDDQKKFVVYKISN